MKPLQLLASIQLLAAQADRPRRFKISAYSGGQLRVDGFAHPVVIDLQGLSAGGNVPIILDHTADVEHTVGSTDSIVNNGQTLVMAGVVTGQSPRVQQVLAASDNGQQWQASVGCSVEQSEDIPDGRVVTVNNQTFRGPVIVARRSVLRETSILPVGADSTTTVNLAASPAKKKGSMMTFETWLAAKGFDPATLTAESTAYLTSLFDAEANSTDPAAAAGATAAALVTLRAAHTADLTRISKIESIAAGFPAIATKAIQAGWSAQETEIAVLKANQRTTAPSNSRTFSGDGVTTAQHLSAALMVKAGYSSAAEKSFGPQVMEQSRHLHGSSLPDLCRAALVIDGKDIPHDRGSMIRAAFSTVSMPVALGDSANKILIEAYKQAPSSWRSFAAVKPAANFKTQTGIRPTFFGDLSQLPPGGSIVHGHVGEETYTWNVNTFAKILTIDRQTMVNDDASTFSDVIPSMARAAARSLNSLVATTLLANAGTFFGSAHSNYFDGAATNLQASSLATAIQKLRQMKDAEGNLLDLRPAVLLVPPELEQTGLALINSSEVARVSTGDNLPTGNVFKDVATLAVEPRLSDTSFSGYSLTHWYLFSNATNAAVIVGFLDGMESPTIESFGLDHDVNTLALSYRVYFDYGCALADFRAAIRSKGAA